MPDKHEKAKVRKREGPAGSRTTERAIELVFLSYSARKWNRGLRIEPIYPPHFPDSTQSGQEA